MDRQSLLILKVIYEATNPKNKVGFTGFISSGDIIRNYQKEAEEKDSDNSIEISLGNLIRSNFVEQSDKNKFIITDKGIEYYEKNSI